MPALSEKRVVVTGASGFVGRQLYRYLQAGGYRVDAWVRGERSAEDDIAALGGVDCVVHLAGRAHVLREQSVDPLRAFREANCANTLRIARAALGAGVQRFVFVSSIGVNGQQTGEVAFDEQSTPTPQADYAVSKHEAELQLRELVHGSAMQLVIIRPPLVYAGHAPGNFRRLLGLVARRLPLPFGAVHNSRSMIALDNLVDFIVRCIEHPAAVDQLFVIADGEDLSIGQIAHFLAQGMGLRSRQLAIPPDLMHGVARLLGREGLYVQLCGSLQVNAGKARELLQWQPPISAQDALRQAGRDYLANKWARRK
jgi:nucleoside-diphosphate-sugar epimerase